MPFEIHGDRETIHHMQGEVPNEFLDKFLALPEDTHMYLVGIQLPRGAGIQWYSQEMSAEVRKVFHTPSIWDRRIMDDLLKKHESGSPN